MHFIPAIDIIEGKCVRLFKGDYGQKKDYGIDPLEMAEIFFSKSTRRLHIVDLEGAKTGKLINSSYVIEIIKKFPDKVIEIGGGIRDEDSIKFYADNGASRIILGSRGARDMDFLIDMVHKYPGKIILGLDIRNQKIATEGWTGDSGIHYLDYMKKLQDSGALPEIIFTDINTDGTLAGPPLELIRDLVKSFSMFKFIASGGISSIQDVENIVSLRLENLIGMISGKAIYEKKIDLSEALLLCE